MVRSNEILLPGSGAVGKRLTPICASLQVPIITAERLPHIQPGALVRFRGIVQNTLEDELYHPRFDAVDEATGARVCISDSWCMTALPILG